MVPSSQASPPECRSRFRSTAVIRAFADTVRCLFRQVAVVGATHLCRSDEGVFLDVGSALGRPGNPIITYRSEMVKKKMTAQGI